MEDKSTILIVDDDESMRKTMSLVLGKKGYETETAGTGQEAIEKARKRFFNLVLLDIKLPDIEGLELLGPLKEMYPDMVTIMATAYASVETAIKALNEGASAYITKPFNMDEVLATVREALEKQHLMFEKRQAEKELRRINDQLKEALAKVKTLSGFLPICANCKKIRDDQDYWHQVEEYITDHSEAEFSHSICPDCAKQLYPEFYKGD